MLKIKANANDDLEISGELSFDSVPKLRLIGCQFIQEHKTPIFDLHAVEIRDISGLALLVAWTRFANEQNKTIRFINLPLKFMGMIKLSGLQEILPLE